MDWDVHWGYGVLTLGHMDRGTAFKRISQTCCMPATNGAGQPKQAKEMALKPTLRRLNAEGSKHVEAQAARVSPRASAGHLSDCPICSFRSIVVGAAVGLVDGFVGLWLRLFCWHCVFRVV